MARQRNDDKLALLQSSVRTLQLVQRVSAGIFSTFLIVHLSAPLIAAVTLTGDAEQQASAFMLVGREWYQGGGYKKEGVVVWGSATVHVLSGVVARAAKNAERKERRKKRKAEVKLAAQRSQALGEDSNLPTFASSSATTTDDFDADRLDDEDPESFPSAVVTKQVETAAIPVSSAPLAPQHLAGYLLIPFVIHHSILHRILPLKQNLTPFFSYSFVGYSLTQSAPLLRAISVIGYAGVAGLGVYHALAGIRVMSDPTAPRSLRPRSRARSDEDGEAGEGLAEAQLGRRAWQVAYVSIVTTMGVGVARIAMSTSGAGKVPVWLVGKYDRVLRQGVGM
ncbi:BQ2448_2526 [Microbotryum intermedium]|uniref:BQ2448_2526 protein n=1 Tax=Microbotryum intermedium TaxID=269621 RepID=A0A238FEJ9_9BASI|nr:BQ2448_2526 [Microbotryum intermedium]